MKISEVKTAVKIGDFVLKQKLTLINMAKKLILDVEEKLWKEVLKYRIDNNFKNNNEAVKNLIERGLKSKKQTD